MEIRAIVPVFLFSLLAIAVAANASTAGPENSWVDATDDIIGGSSTLASFAANQTVSSSTTQDDAQTIIEVYTATWCETCVPAEEALDATIEGKTTQLVKYHRHLFETEDPFGNNNTEGRWLSRYGPSAAQAGFSARTPPTVVFGGERMHIGSHPEPGTTLEEEYSRSLEIESRPPISGHSEFTFTWEDGTFEWSWDWEEDTTACRSTCDQVTTDLFLMVIEDTAFFPEGSNGQEIYHRILRDVIPMENNSIEYSLPEAWDGDDLSILVVLDWREIPPSTTFFQSLPSVGLEFVIAILALTAMFNSKRLEKNAGFNNLR